MAEQKLSTNDFTNLHDAVLKKTIAAILLTYSNIIYVFIKFTPLLLGILALKAQGPFIKEEPDIGGFFIGLFIIQIIWNVFQESLPESIHNILKFFMEGDPDMKLSYPESAISSDLYKNTDNIV